MSKFHRSSEYSRLAMSTVALTIHVSREELMACRTTGHFIALANEKREQALSQLAGQLVGLSIDLAAATKLFEEPLMRIAKDQPDAEGAPV